MNIEKFGKQLSDLVKSGRVQDDAATQALLLARVAQQLGRIADALENPVQALQQEHSGPDEPVRYTPFCECGERLPCSCSTSRVEL